MSNNSKTIQDEAITQVGDEADKLVHLIEAYEMEQDPEVRELMLPTMKRMSEGLSSTLEVTFSN
jgi:hypothetical protein